MRRHRPLARVAAVLTAVALALAGCTGVPSDSSPMVIKTVPIGGVDGQAVATTPAPGILPNNLVADFLQANALDASQQTSPRPFLSPAARNSWSDTTVTVVDTPKVGFYSPQKSTVLVKARILGTLSSSGVYTPTLDGADSPRQAFVYGVKLVDGQYRITSLRNGLLLSEADFISYYTQRSVYFFDLAHHYLVPDPRWTSLTDPTQLADFLLAGLSNGPGPEIQSVVSTDTLPGRATAPRISVQVGTTTTIEIPGAGQLATVGRNRLAEQVAATLADVVRSGDLVITDGGKAVRIPAVDGTRFTVADFASRFGPPQPPADVYFLRKGLIYGVYGRQDTRLRGAANGEYFLQSVAVSQDKAQGSLALAATAGPSAQHRRLLVGTQSGGLRLTDVEGPLTRPAFAPGRSEVWVGDGQKVYAVTVDNGARTQHAVSVGLPSGAAGGQVVALRLSPDGSRIALVIRTAGGDQQLYVGAVDRGPGSVRIDTPLQQVTPEGIDVADVAWVEPLKLLAIGTDPTTGEHQVYAVGSDGSGFSAQGTGNLPGGPTDLTVAVHQPAWVTATAAVWEQDIGDVWRSPGPSSETDGYAPIYLE